MERKFAGPMTGLLRGVDIVWRPFLYYPAICLGCKDMIKEMDQPALWGGRRSGAPMSHWHVGCFDGEYKVNPKDQAAYERWKANGEKA